MVIYLAPLVALIGLVLFLAVRNNGDVREIGKIMFFCGLLVTLMFLAGGRAYHLP